MGKRGPKPQPTALRVLKDNPGKRPLPNEPKPKVAAQPPRMPAGLGSAARAAWKRLAPRLHALELLTENDVDTFQVYCETWQNYRDALREFAAWQRKSKAKSFIYSAPNGALAIHPAWKMAKEARADLIRIGSLFGLSPSSRAGLHIEGGEAEGEDDTLD